MPVPACCARNAVHRDYGVKIKKGKKKIELTVVASCWDPLAVVPGNTTRSALFAPPDPLV